MIKRITALVTLGSFIICLAPTMFNMKVTYEHFLLIETLNSLDVHYSLIASISMSISALLFLLVDIYKFSNYLIPENICNVSLVIILLTLDIFTFSFALPNDDINLFNSLYHAKLVLLPGIHIIYLNANGGCLFKSKFICFSLICYFLGILLLVFVPYTQIPCFGGIFCLCVGILGFLIISCTSLKSLWRTVVGREKKEVLSKEYSCFQFLTFSVFIFLIIFIQSAIYQFPPLTSFSSTFLATQILLFSLYPIFIPIIHNFQSRLSIRESDVDFTLDTTQRQVDIKEMFMRYMSHEMRTPLNIILTGLSFIEEDMRRRGDSPLRLQTVIDCQRSCDIATSILDDHISYDNIEKGLYVLEKSEQIASTYFENEISPFRIEAISREVDLIVTPLVSEPLKTVVIDIDTRKMSQVVRNLLSNSLKFTAEGGTVKIELKYIATDETNGTLIVEVKDTGAGMVEEEYSQLFKAVIQFQPGVLQGGRGSGLGLYISKGIVDLHNGKISAWSAGYNTGSTFTLELPARLIPTSALARSSLTEDKIERSTNRLGSRFESRSYDSPNRNIQTPVELLIDRKSSGVRSISSLKLQNLTSTQRKQSSISQIRRRSTDSVRDFLPEDNLSDSDSDSDDNIKRLETEIDNEEEEELETKWKKSFLPKVLVVDDTELNRKVMCRLLSIRSSSCEEAVDGLDAVAKVKQSLEDNTPFDVITMDFQMPNMDGPTATKKIRELGFTGLIIAVTGNALAADKEYFMHQGATAVLVKPLDTNRFDELLQSKLGTSYRVL